MPVVLPMNDLDHMWPNPLNIIKEDHQNSPGVRRKDARGSKMRATSSTSVEQSLVVQKRRNHDQKQFQPTDAIHDTGHGRAKVPWSYSGNGFRLPLFPTASRPRAFYNTEMAASTPTLFTTMTMSNCSPRSIIKHQIYTDLSKGSDICFSDNKLQEFSDEAGSSRNIWSNDQHDYNGSNGHGQNSTSKLPDLPLSPILKLTPSSRSAAVNQDGIWVAIEVLLRSTESQLCSKCPSSFYDDHSNVPAPNQWSLDGESRHLSHLEMEITPARGCQILRIVGKEKQSVGGRPDGVASIIQIPHISANLGFLVLAYVRIPKSPISSGTDDVTALMTDLELQLGSLSLKFIKVRLRHRQDDGKPPSAQAPFQEVHATGVVKRNDGTSIWSLGSPNRQPSLFSVIASHWGRVRAHKVLQEVILAKQQSVGEPQDSAATVNGLELRARSNMISPVSIPQRRASLQKPASPQPLLDRAQQIWMAIKRAHSGDHPEVLVKIADPATNPVPAETIIPPVSQDMRSRSSLDYSAKVCPQKPNRNNENARPNYDYRLGRRGLGDWL